MIEILKDDWAAEKRDKFRAMMNSSTMLSFLDQLIQKRDALIAESGYCAFTGQVGDASCKQKRAIAIDITINELRAYANEVEIPASVKIITKP